MSESLPRTRRAFLATLVGGTAAAIAAVIGRPLDVRADDGDPMTLGQENSASTTTTLRNSDASAGFMVFSDGASAIAGQAGGEGGHGVQGIAAGENRAGVWGHNPGPGAGVAGLSNDGVGVNGRAVSGVGMLAQVDDTHGTALEVQGRVVFSRSGVITVAKGRSSAVRALQGVTMSSLVFAVVRNGDAKAWVRKAAPGTNEFTVLLNKEVSSATTVAWFVLD